MKNKIKILTATHAISQILDQIHIIHIRLQRLFQIIKLLEKLLIIRDQLNLMQMLVVEIRKKIRKDLLKWTAIHAIPQILDQTHIITGREMLKLNLSDQLIHQQKEETRKMTRRKRTKRDSLKLNLRLMVKLIATHVINQIRVRTHIIHLLAQLLLFQDINQVKTQLLDKKWL